VNRIKELRKAKKISGIKLAGLLGTSAQYLYELEKGEKRLNETLIRRLAEIFNVSADYLLGIEKNKEELPKEAIPAGEFKQVPIYGEIRAGKPMFVEEEILGYESIPKNFVRSEDYFFLRIKGNSMIDAHINEGDLVLVRRQPLLENGEIGVVIVDGENLATIKRYYKNGDLVILKPENSSYAPKAYPPDKIRIVGKVIKTIRNFE